MWRKGNPLTLLVRMYIGAASMENIWRFLKKLKIEPLYNLAIPVLGIYPKKIKSLILKDICTPVFIAPLFTIVKIWKQANCPSTDEWLNKM